MNTDLERLKHDLKVIEHGLGSDPEYGRGHIWASVGWGLNGVLLMLGAIFPKAVPPPPWNAAIAVLLWLGLPPALARVAGYSFSYRSSSARERNASLAAAALTVLLLGVMFWMSHLVLPPTLFPAIMFLLIGSWFLFIAFDNRWRRGFLAWALSKSADTSEAKKRSSDCAQKPLTKSPLRVGKL
jgi:hypothetical protein